MLTLCAALIIPAVALPSVSLKSKQSQRTVSIVLLMSAYISINTLNISAMGYGNDLFNDLLKVTSLSQTIDIFIFLIGSCAIITWSPISKKFSEINLKNSPIVSEFNLFILFSICGSSFLVSSNNLVSLYLSIELQSFGVYILATLYNYSKSSTAAGLQYLILGGLSSAIIILGASIIYTSLGTIEFEKIFRLISIDNTKITGSSIGFCLIGVGLLFKISAAPFHQWAPDVYQGVPTIVAIWLAVIPKISVLNLLLILTNKNNSNWLDVIVISSILSLIIGTIVGLSQNKIKRLLAYSTISHIGWLLIALSINNKESYESYLFYLTQYTITALLSFMIILSFGFKINHDINYINELSGKIKNEPYLCFSFAACIFSIAGVPPHIGFFAKQSILSVALDSNYSFLAFLAIITSIVGGFYYLRIIWVIYFNSEIETSDFKRLNITSFTSFLISFFTFILIFYILYPSIYLKSISLLALTLNFN